MRKKSMLAILSIIILCLMACQPNQTNPLEGNWELVAVEGAYEIEGNQIKMNMKKDADNFGMKLIHDGYFMFSNQQIIDGEKSAGYGYGSYAYDNNIYTENIIYHSGKDLIGTKLSFEMTVSGNTLTQKGPIKNDTDMQFIETYVRK